ncbi:hypothetical protein [Desulfogranum japonicum]|uniref:hypothetical protein n=1 Tax=Desulfogranum japonicum TaxID=231447 RepID=UPI0003FDFE1D|nr:hypothetical protein [Desulfogranum japonicum]
MEKILVPVVAGEKNIWAVIHGLQLARRVQGTVTILEIDVSGEQEQASARIPPINRNIIHQRWREQAEQKEVSYEYVQVKGSFCREIRRFCYRNSHSTLILEMSVNGKKTTPEAMLKMARTLQTEKICKVELLMNS